MDFGTETSRIVYNTGKEWGTIALTEIAKMCIMERKTDKTRGKQVKLKSRMKGTRIEARGGNVMNETERKRRNNETRKQKS